MESLKTAEIAKLIYKSRGRTSELLTDAVRDNKITRLLKGHYKDDEALKKWIIETRGFE